jgi:hypothetical protein
MATLRQALERQRENGKLPQGDVVSLRGLHQDFHPSPSGSARALLLKMFEGVSKKLPWAIILCRFKGSAPNPELEEPIERFYREIFTPGSGGLIEYWRDVSLGAIDITGSRIFGWVEVEIPRKKAGGTPPGPNGTTPPGPGRSGLVDFAISAVQREGGDPLGGFHSQIAIYAHNWSKDGVTQDDGDFATGWGPFWIDGSADSRGKVTLTPPHAGDLTEHEMGHGFGMKHDVSADFQTHYADPCCIMSQAPLFRHPVWKVMFGPAVCLPHLIQQDWMYRQRVFIDDGAWMLLADGITLPLAPTSDPGARANLGIKLTYKKADAAWDYYLEYARPTGWNQGLSDASLFIRRIGPGKDIGDTPAILGSIIVPSTIGTRAQFVEPSGNVRFQVERFDPEGRIVRVNARKL